MRDNINDFANDRDRWQLWWSGAKNNPGAEKQEEKSRFFGTRRETMFLYLYCLRPTVEGMIDSINKC